MFHINWSMIHILLNLLFFLIIIVFWVIFFIIVFLIFCVIIISFFFSLFIIIFWIVLVFRFIFLLRSSWLLWLGFSSRLGISFLVLIYYRFSLIIAAIINNLILFFILTLFLFVISTITHLSIIFTFSILFMRFAKVNWRINRLVIICCCSSRINITVIKLSYFYSWTL